MTEEPKAVERLKVVGQELPLTKTSAPKGATMAEILQAKRKPPTGKLDVDTLYIDCFPTGLPNVAHFADIVSPVIEEVLEEHKAIDWRVHPLDFGKGRGYIAAKLKAMELPSHIYVSSREDLMDIAVSVVGTRAMNIIIGVK